jgi:ribosome maturation factor RimP
MIKVKDALWLQLTRCFFLYDNNSMQLDDKAIAKRVKEMVFPIVSRMGYRLFDVEFKSERGWVLRIIVDKEGGITVGDCEEVSKRISALLDVEDIIPVSYMLEVSSPGLTRELTKAEHFSFFKGRLVRAILREPIQNRRELIGEIEDVKEEVLILRDKGTGELLHIPLSVIARANLEIEKW